LPLPFILAANPLMQILEHETRQGLLHKLCCKVSILRTSLYADVAALFIAPIIEDIQNLATILERFG
jgi:hypothetical protein